MKTDKVIAENSAEMVTIPKTEYDKMQAKTSLMEQQIQWLMEQLKLSKRQQFGASSEKTPLEQLNLLDTFNEAEATADLTIPEPDITTIKAHTRKKIRLTTDRLPEDLHVQEVIHDLLSDEKICFICDNNLRVIGKETRDELVLVPATAYIRRHVQLVYGCENCEKTGESTPIVKAEMPPAVIKGGFASPEAIAYIAYQKFVMGVPLYRQEQEWAQKGIMLSRQTMSNWLIKASDLYLKPIYDHIRSLFLVETVGHADETTLQVLKEKDKSAQSKSYMWLYRTSGCAERQIVLFEYQPDRKAAHPAEFLSVFTGFLHADGYEAYHKLPETIKVVGCWAHLRRKFDEALTVLPKEKQADSAAAKALAYINKLFHLEKQFSLLATEQRKDQRETLSKPIIDEFYNWLNSVNVLPKSSLGKAITYAISQKKYLLNYLLDGRLEISNNRAENSIRPFVMGRKNWLFSNTPNGARSSAIYYSLISSAKENGLNPFDYLTKILTQAPNGASAEELLPWGNQ